MSLSDRSTDELLRGRKKVFARQKAATEALRETAFKLKEGTVTPMELKAATQAVEAGAKRLRLLDEELESREAPSRDPFYYGTAPVEASAVED